MKKVFTLFVLVLLFFGKVQAQYMAIDSLEKVLEKTDNESKRVDLLMQLSWKCRDIFPHKTVEYGEMALDNASDLGKTNLMPKILNFIGIGYRNMGRYSEALDSYHNGLLQAEEIEDLEQAGYAYINIGNLYFFQGRYLKSLESLSRAMDYAEQADNQILKSFCTQNLGFVYLAEGAYSEALKYQTETLKLRKGGKEEDIISAIYSLGDVHLKRGSYDKALEKYQNGIQRAQNINYEIMVYTLYQAMGNAYNFRHEPGDLENALNFYLKAEEGFSSVNRKDKIPALMTDIALVLSKMDKNDEAILYAEKGLAVGQEIGQNREVRRLYEILASVYDKKEEKEKALDYLKKYVLLTKELHNEELVSKRNRLHINLALSEKENEIETLVSKHDIAQAELKAKESFMIALGISLFVSAIAGLMALISSRKVKKVNEKLIEKREKIEHQKEHIESVNQELEDKYKHLRITMDKLRRTQYQLLESDKVSSMGFLSASIAHEIKNPVNLVMDNAKQLRKDLKEIAELLQLSKELDAENYNEKVNEIIALWKEKNLSFTVQEIDDLMDGIEDGAARTIDIVASLRKFTEEEPEKMRHSDIHKIVDYTLQFLYRKDKSKELIPVEKHYSESLPKFNCDPVKMGQVFMNILDNAFYALQDISEPKINIHTALKNNHPSFPKQDVIVVSFTDNAGGMSEETIKHIFEPFFTTKAHSQGSGLGLPISYGIIEQHHGKIKVSSEKGKGSTFDVVLPLEHI